MMNAVYNIVSVIYIFMKPHFSNQSMYWAVSYEIKSQTIRKASVTPAHFNFPVKWANIVKLLLYNTELNKWNSEHLLFHSYMCEEIHRPLYLAHALPSMVLGILRLRQKLLQLSLMEKPENEQAN